MRNIRRTLSKRLNERAKELKLEKVMIGRADGTILVSATDKYLIWCTDKSGVPHKVINRRLPNRLWAEVKITTYPTGSGYPEVVEYSNAYSDVTWQGPEVKDHADTHDFGQYDCDWIKQERILDFVPVAGLNSIDMYPTDAIYLDDGTWKWEPDVVRVDYSASIPTYGARVTIVAYDTTGTIELVDGSIVAGSMYTLTDADIPALSAGYTALVGLRLFAGMTQAYNEPGKVTFIKMGRSGATASGTAGITSLTGDGTATGPGAAALTLATVNSNVGSFTNSSITVNAKGLVTAASNGVSPVFYDTEANILAATKAAGTIAVSSDTYYLFESLGSAAWMKHPFRMKPESANPDMGYLQDSSRIGYGETYITDKTLNNVVIGANGTASTGGIKVVSATAYIYLNGSWQPVVTNFVFREDSTFGYTLEHQPIGFTNYLEIMTGQSLGNLGLNGLPLTNGYKTSMGAYGVPTKIGGRTI